MRACSARGRIAAIAAVVGALAFGGVAATPANGLPDRTARPLSEGVPYDDISSLAPRFSVGSKWPGTNLTYSFGAGTPDIAGDEERDAVRLALDLWEAESSLRFTEVAGGGDIFVLWATGDHGDGGFGNGVLAHAYFPTIGDTHFNDAFTWDGTLPLSPGAADLVTVAAHEFGHSIGIGHSNDSAAIMFPYYSGPHRFLSQDDIDAVQFLYGDGPTPPPPPPPPPTTVSIGDVTVTEPARGRTNATFEISLSSPATTTTKVRWQTKDVTATAGSDYRSASGTATIKKGNSSAGVRVRVKHDDVAEATETFRVVLHSPTNAEIVDGIATGTILDDIGD